MISAIKLGGVLGLGKDYSSEVDTASYVCLLE